MQWHPLHLSLILIHTLDFIHDELMVRMRKGSRLNLWALPLQLHEEYNFNPRGTKTLSPIP